MYSPGMFAVTDPGEMSRILADLRLGCLVTKDADGFFGSHIPMLFDPARNVLAGHISKANSHPARCGDGDALAIFQGPTPMFRRIGIRPRLSTARLCQPGIMRWSILRGP